MRIPVKYITVRGHLMTCITLVGDFANLLDIDDKTAWNKKVESFYCNMLELGDLLRIDIVAAIRAKMVLNNKKYPKKLCRGNIQKYDAYKHETKIDKTHGQYIDDKAEIDRRLVQE